MKVDKSGQNGRPLMDMTELFCEILTVNLLNMAKTHFMKWLTFRLKTRNAIVNRWHRSRHPFMSTIIHFVHSVHCPLREFSFVAIFAISFMTPLARCGRHFTFFLKT